MGSGHYVPGYERHEAAKYKGKKVWEEIMQCTNETAIEYAVRVDADFNRKIQKDASNRAKVRFLLGRNDVVKNLP